MKRIERICVSLVLLVGLAAAGAEPPIPAPGPNTVHVVSFVEVSQAAIPRAVGVVRQYRDAARKESGSGGAELFQEIGRPYRFVVNEAWTDQASFDAHRRSGAATQFAAGLKAMQTAPVESHVLRNLGVGPENPPGA